MTNDSNTWDWRRVQWLALGAVFFLVNGPLEAVSQPTERIPETVSLQQRFGRVTVHSAGSLSHEAQRLKGGLQVRQLFNSPWFVSSDVGLSAENHPSYNLHHWGDEVSVGRAINETTDLLATYRFDRYNVFHTGATTDPAFRTVAGNSTVTALGTALQHDSRDDGFYPTYGWRGRLGGELALQGLGGDYNFSRLDTDVSVYLSPFHEQVRGTWLEDLTFVEHLRVGWMAPFRRCHPVPFFERYFVGGANTVRGHRNRWISPRGAEDEFLGGNVQLINNMEVRVPVFPYLLHRRLSTGVFFDVGEAAQGISKIGDFGYGAGVGLRYVVKLWKLQGVARVDYGIDLAREAGGDTSSRVHLTFGIPF